MLAMTLLIPVVWLLKSFVYWGIFRFRTIPVTVLNCLVIAGSPLLFSIIPIPSILYLPASIALASYLTMHYTGVALIPDGLFVPLGVEVAFWGALWMVRSLGVLV